VVQAHYRYHLETDEQHLMAANTEKVYTSFAQTRLEEAISDSDLCCLIVDEPTQLFPRWEGGYEFYLTLVDASANREIVKVTGISGRWLTISRGQQSTTARSWPIGTLVEQRPTADDMSDIIQREGFRTVAYNPNGVLTANYPGEKIFFQEEIWWKNISGTAWQMIAGDCDDIPYTALDYTTFTEVDVPADRATVVDASSITVTDLDRDEAVWVYKDFGANYFNNVAHWEFRFEAKFTGSTGFGTCGLWTLSQDLLGWDDIFDACKPALSVRWASDSDGWNPVYLWNSGFLGHEGNSLDLDVDYYFTVDINRSASKVYCHIYTDPARTVLDQTLRIDYSDSDEYQYLFAMQGHYDPWGGDAWSGSIKNLEMRVSC